MKQGLIFCSLYLLCIALSGIGFGQNMQIYEHPSLNLEIQAFDDWLVIPHPENALMYEIRDPESGLQLMMWSTETEDEGPVYLIKTAEQKKLVHDAEPVKGKINKRDAWFLDATCCMNESPFRVVLIAIPAEEEKNGLYVTQVVCPENKLKDQENRMEGIIYSLRITE